MNKMLLSLALLAAAGAAAAPAAAQSRGDWTLGVGLHNVSPKSDNGALAGGTLPVSIGDSVRPTITGEYFIRDGLGIEVLAALPFEHDINIAGLGKIGSTKHLPPVVSLQYHFNHAGKVSPFVGVGVNYTRFFSEDTRGALAGSNLSLDDSWGVAGHIGVDFKLAENTALRLDARYIDISSDVSLDGANLGKVDIDPRVYGLSLMLTF